MPAVDDDFGPHQRVLRHVHSRDLQPTYLSTKSGSLIYQLSVFCPRSVCELENPIVPLQVRVSSERTEHLVVHLSAICGPNGIGRVMIHGEQCVVAVEACTTYDVLSHSLSLILAHSLALYLNVPSSPYLTHSLSFSRLIATACKARCRPW